MRQRFCLALILLGFLGARTVQAEEVDAVAGKAVYTQRCASCHGAEGEGKEALAKMLKVEMRHLGSEEVQAKSDGQLRKDSVEGTGKMRPVKGMSDKEVADLIAYVRTLAKK